MAFKLVQSGGAVVDPAVIRVFGSGTIKPNESVDWNRDADYLVSPTTSSSTTTMVFGIAKSYAQGESDTEVLVIPFASGQLWQADCANAVTTGQLGVRQALSASDRAVIHNQETDNVDHTGIFLPLSITGSTSGSGKLIGKFIFTDNVVGQNDTTFI